MLDLHDFVNNELVSNSIPPQSTTASLVGTVGDFGNGQGYCVAEVYVGHILDGTYQFCVRESSASGSGFSTITGTTMATLSTVSMATIAQLMFARTKRYLRLICTVGGAVSAGGHVGGSIRSVRRISGPGSRGTNV